MKRARKSKFKEGDPLHFNSIFRYALEVQLRVLVEEAKYIRWYRNETYLRFRMFDESYKILVSEEYQPDDNLRVYNNGGWTTFGQLPVYYNNGSWVINAIRFCNTNNDVVFACLDISNYLAKHYTAENYNEMAAFAESLDIDPVSLDYEYVREEDGEFRIFLSNEYLEMLDEFTLKYMAHQKLTNDKNGILLQVMKQLSMSLFADTIDFIEKQKCGTLQQ